ncbi:hypothetical protein EDB87DRAFT_1687262 [Lactarius vividus]|nr:hypothetical protein EDB87DRAFT_1687262 [Lactarius vividus]
MFLLTSPFTPTAIISEHTNATPRYSPTLLTTTVSDQKGTHVIPTPKSGQPVTTRDLWIPFHPYHIDRRGERNVPKQYLKGAFWQTEQGDPGYVISYTYKDGTTGLIPVEFNFEHTCWTKLKWDALHYKLQVVRPAGSGLHIDILQSEVTTRDQWGPLDGQEEEPVRSPTPKTPAPSPSLASNPEEIRILEAQAEEEELELGLIAENPHVSVAEKDHRLEDMAEEEETMEKEVIREDPSSQGQTFPAVTLQRVHLPESDYSTGNLGFLLYHGGDQDFDWSIFRCNPFAAILLSGAARVCTGRAGFRMERNTSGTKPEKFMGKEPLVFTGDRTKVQQFLTQWELFVETNYDNPAFTLPYHKALIFLTYIQGDHVNEWVLSTTKWVKAYKVKHGPYDKWIWEAIKLGFCNTFADTLEKEHAQQDLQKGFRMEGQDIDSYVAKFEKAVLRSRIPLRRLPRPQ